jgi:hypothetical protein
MSGGAICRCEERKKPLAKRRWEVMQRYCNHSAFNGYRMDPSDWSSIRCARCHANWRTKARYVSALRDYKAETP